MEYVEDLNKLESNIEKILQSLATVQGDKVKLQADIACLEEDKKRLEEQIKCLKDEKKNVHQRVSGLLGSIEKWEKSSVLAADQASSANFIGKVSSEPVQGLLIGS
jgi:septal ring factor EnvC (AmiA/AmiB activator)